MTAIEERLVSALDELDLPETDVVDAVLARIVAADDDRAPLVPIRRAGRVPRFALAAAMIAVLSALVVAVTPPAREAVARWLGVGATRVEVVPTTTAGDAATPATEVVSTTVPRAAPPGTPVELAADPIPALGPPAGVVDNGAARSYTWPPADRLPALGDTGVAVVLTVRPEAGGLDVKRVADDVGVEFVTLEFAGSVVPALWIDGAHEYLAAGSATPVLADRVLIWVAGGIQYRLEAGIELGEAIALATSVEGGTDLLPPG